MILIALGANLPSRLAGSPRATCEMALDALARRAVRPLRRSRWYRSAPVPPSDQPDFVNGVAMVGSSHTPEDLLALLHDVERRLGRVRGAAGAARTIDLDLIAHGDTVAGWPDDGDGDGGLVLPHPRLHLRAFVLMPLGDVAPGWRHPVRGIGVAEMIAALPPGQDCAPLD